MPTSSGFSVNEVLTSNNTNKYLLRAGRNALINGAMAIAQRSSSITGITTSNYYTADRWYQTINTLGTWTQSVQDVTASGAPMADGIRNSLKITCTTANASPAAGAFNVMLQTIEGYNTQQFAKGNASAKPFALSFWVRSNVTGTYIAELYDLQNSRTVSASYTIAASGTWQKVRIVFPADTASGFLNDNSGQMQVLLWVGAGSNYTSGTLQTTWATHTANKRAVGQVNVASAINNYFEFTAVQLEPDSVCTPFEQEDIATTYAKCQRYFQTHINPRLRGVVGVAATGFFRLGMTIPPMRAVPTTTTAGTAWWYDGLSTAAAALAITADYTNQIDSVEYDFGGSGWGAGRPAMFIMSPTYTSWLYLNAEL